MNFKKKRLAAGISKYTMMKELGVDKNKYDKIESGKLQLSGNLLDKFMEVIKNSREINFNRQVKLEKINQWIQSGEIKTAIEDYGYNQITLGAELGIGNSLINKIVNGLAGTDDNKEMIYDFLHNPLNKNTEPIKKVVRKPKTKKTKKVEKVETAEISSNITEEQLSADFQPTQLDIETAKDSYIRDLENQQIELYKDNEFYKECLKRLFKL